MFGNRMLFCFVPGGFLRSNKLEQLEFKLGKKIEIQKHAGKVRKLVLLILSDGLRMY